MSEKTIVAIMYDFDRTLSTRDMQEFSFIPRLGMDSAEFWSFANDLGTREHMDSVLAYLYAMVRMSEQRGIPLRRIEGTKIADKFRSIFACEFLYDSSGKPVWPKTDVNYTNKTQFVYRINKGVLDVENDLDLNRSMPDDSKRVPFCNMIYIGDGLSDVPCMKMMKAYGGYSIAVYQDRKKVEALLERNRVDFIYPADYREGSGLDVTVRNIIRKMAISDVLFHENAAQKRGQE